jgi:hypothetical protein
MKNYRFVLLLTLVTAVILASWPAGAFALATDPGLATAGNFAVMAGTTVTNTGPSQVTGQIAVSPGTSITGFPPGRSGIIHVADTVGTIAQNDLTAAYTRSLGGAQPCPPANDRTGVNLGGLTLVPGVYCQTTAPTLTGVLTLNGAGVYLFQIGSTLVTASGASVVCVAPCDPCEVFWQVSSTATLGTTTSFVGNIMALTSIAMQNGASLRGRALARNGAVTLDTNVITQPSGCSYAANPTPLAAVVPTPAPTAKVGLPNTGGPPGQPGLPWLPLSVAVAIGALLFGVRRRTHKPGP